MERQSWTDSPVVLWAAAGIGTLLAVLIGVLAFPRRVYDEFIWQYLWGPVQADAHGVGTAGCAIREDGAITYHSSAEVCSQAAGIVAQPGYTVPSYIVYGLILLWAVVGIYFLIERFNIAAEPRAFYALVPFVFLGGSLRVVEDGNAQLYRETGEFLIGMPWAGFIISPLIYFVVFLITAVVLFSSVIAERRGHIDRYELPLVATGILLLLVTFGILSYFVVGTELGHVNWAVPIITLGGATVITGLVWWTTETYRPSINEATGFMGAIVIWGHTVDGIANVLSLDWGHHIGLTRDYTPKHLVNQGIIDVTSAMQPAAVTDSIGAAWPFLPVKVLVAVAVVAIFNDEAFEDSRSLSMLFLVVILAVGLGPGTRDFLRATLGI